MKIYNKDLRRAWRWLGSTRTAKAIRFLEPKIPLFLEDPVFYAILGRACLESGLVKDAETYLGRGLQTDPSHIDIRLSLAIVGLRRKDPASAVRIWLEILDDDPKNKLARRGLKTLKGISDQDAQNRFLEHLDQKRFLPSLSPRWPRWIFPVLGTALVFALSFYFRDTLVNWAETFAKDPRPGAETIELRRKDQLVEPEAPGMYTLDDDGVYQTFRAALKHFQDYEDNFARRELNRLLYSNATPQVKTQALTLIESLGEPSLEDFDQHFQYAQVISEPLLYEGCWVLWKGRAANISYEDESIVFDFLIGFENQQVLEGQTRVTIPFLVVMEPLPLEILGQVQLNGEHVSLVAKTVHFLR